MKHIRYKKSANPGESFVKPKATKYFLEFLKIFGLDKPPYVNYWAEDFVDECSDPIQVVTLQRHEILYDNLPEFIPISYLVRSGTEYPWGWIKCMGIQIDFTFKLLEPDPNVPLEPYVLEFHVNDVRYQTYVRGPKFGRQVIAELLQIMMEEISK